MPGISQRRFFSTIRGPSAEALDLLGPFSKEISAVWLHEIQSLGVQTGQLPGRGLLDFGQLAETLRKHSYTAFRQDLQAFGDKLAHQGVRMDRVVNALDRLFEISLSSLQRSTPKRATPILALARLHALVLLLIVSGYTDQWAAGKKNLMEATLSEDEDRRRAASAYVTRIYEQERRRLSQDLHDEIGHALILLKLNLEMMELENLGYHNGHQREQPRLKEAINLVSSTIDSVRRLVLDLGPAVFEDLGFLPAVRSYISQFSSHTKIKVKLRESYLPAEIPTSHQVALYRILQGALSNVLKHSAAANVTISLGSMRDQVLIMVIEDDGAGFELSSMTGRKFGLTAMRERAEVLGGRFHVQSRPSTSLSKSHGTRIEVDLPLPGGEKT